MKRLLFYISTYLLVSSEFGGEHTGLKTKWSDCPKVLPDLQVGDLIEFDRKIVDTTIIQNVASSLISEALISRPMLESTKQKVIDFMKQDVRYQHWAIYTGNATGTPLVINYRLDSIMEKNTLNYSNPNATRILFNELQAIIEEPLRNAIGDSRCRINNRLDWIHPQYQPTMVVERARKLLNTFRYDAYNNNCESIARWARNGVRKSMQVMRRFQDIKALDVEETTRRQIWGIYDTKCEKFFEDAVRYESLLNDEKDEETNRSPLRRTDKAFTQTLPTFRVENTTNHPYFCPIK